MHIQSNDISTRNPPKRTYPTNPYSNVLARVASKAAGIDLATLTLSPVALRVLRNAVYKYILHTLKKENQQRYRNVLKAHGR